MTKAEFNQLAMLIKELYPRDEKMFSHPSQLEIWYQMLSDIGYNEAVSAVAKHAQTNTFPPSIADIRRGSEETTEWLVAYDDALYIIGRYGTYSKDEGFAAMDDITRDTVKLIGYDRMAQAQPHDPQIKREFREIYEHTTQEYQHRKRIAAGAGDVKCLTAT